MKHRKIIPVVLVLMVGVVLSLRADIKITEGEKIAFLGDSITAQGNRSLGYINLVIAGLQANGIKAGKIPAGIGGHKSDQMLERVDRDIIARKPDIMLLSCGVNDVWHGPRGISLEKYRENIRTLVDKVQNAGIKVYIMTATMTGEDPANENNRKLDEYNSFLRELATEKGCPLIDLNADMKQKIKDIKKQYPELKGNLLTTDGVHMELQGYMMMATSILRAFGLSDAQMEKTEQTWDSMRGVENVRIQFTVAEYRALLDKASAAGLSLGDYIHRIVIENNEK